MKLEQKKGVNCNSGGNNGIIFSVEALSNCFLIIDEDGHQYIEIGYYFAHLMLQAQALKLLDASRATPVDGSPAKTPSDISSHDQKKSYMSAISHLSTQILQRVRRVEVEEIRVRSLIFPTNSSTSLILFTS
jgi:hypothetical protein